MSPPMNNYLNTTKFQNLLNEFIFDNKKLSSLEIFDKNKVFDLTKKYLPIIGIMSFATVGLIVIDKEKLKKKIKYFRKFNDT